LVFTIAASRALQRQSEPLRRGDQPLQSELLRLRGTHGLAQTVGDSASARWKSSIAYLRIQRDYLARLAQDPAGTYLGETTRLTQDSFLIDLTVPLAWKIKLLAARALSNSSSNMRYEKTFKYNYTSSANGRLLLFVVVGDGVRSCCIGALFCLNDSGASWI